VSDATFPAHYRLEHVDAFEMTFATAAVAHCSLCRQIISGMGGGGYLLCELCGSLLIRGKVPPPPKDIQG